MYGLAVSDMDDQDLAFYASYESTGISSLLPCTSDHREVKRVRTRTHDRFARDQSIETIDFIKVDT